MCKWLYFNWSIVIIDQPFFSKGDQKYVLKNIYSYAHMKVKAQFKSLVIKLI